MLRDNHEPWPPLGGSKEETMKQRLFLCLMLTLIAGLLVRTSASAQTGAKNGEWRTYGGDLASTDWRHLGRLAGLTNQKPQRCTASGYAPWVKLVHAHAGLAPAAEALLQAVRASAPPASLSVPGTNAALRSRLQSPQTASTSVTAAEANRIYCDCMERWRIHERFPQPDWSIVDLWIARHLLSRGMPAARIQDILRLASPLFPRRHGDPEDYLRRTLARAAFPLPRPPRPVCADHA